MKDLALELIKMLDAEVQGTPWRPEAVAIKRVALRMHEIFAKRGINVDKEGAEELARLHQKEE